MTVPQPVVSDETPQVDGTSRKRSIDVSSTRTLHDQYVEKQDPEGEKFETLKREDKVILTLFGDVQYNVNLSTKVHVQDWTPLGDVEHGTRTCCEQSGLKRRGI